MATNQHPLTRLMADRAYYSSDEASQDDQAETFAWEILRDEELDGFEVNR